MSNSMNPQSPFKKSCIGVGILYSERTDTTIQNPGMPNQMIIKTFATAKVTTQHGSSTAMNLEATMASVRAKSSVNIQVTYGSTSGQAEAQTPAFQKKKLTPSKKKQSYSSKLAKHLGMPTNQ